MSDPNPNVKVFSAPDGGRYVSSRSLTHQGTVVTVAMRRSPAADNKERRIFFDYQVLNVAQEQQQQAERSSSGTDNKPQVGESLDSDCWLINPIPLGFPDESREAGLNISPLQKIPAVDKAGKGEKDGVVVTETSIDTWASTTARWTHPQVKHFELLSDGDYIYLFRQGVDDVLLCDRFTTMAGRLLSTLEVRYQRSGDLCIPLNEKDTLSSRNINDEPFYEPTLRLGFLGTLAPPSPTEEPGAALRDGRFSVLRLPTAINQIFRWHFFVWREGARLVENIAVDSAQGAGIFDLKGRTYYSCGSELHEDVFSTEGGSCSAIVPEQGRECELARVPVAQQGSTAPNWALSLRDGAHLKVQGSPFVSLAHPGGFTLEAWIAPAAFEAAPKPTVEVAQPEPAAPPPAQPATLAAVPEVEGDEADDGEADDGEADEGDEDDEAASEEGSADEEEEDDDSGDFDEGDGDDSSATSQAPDEGDDDDDDDALIDVEDAKEAAASGANTISPSSTYCLFSLADGPSLWLNSEYRLVLRSGRDGQAIFTSLDVVEPDVWSHVALVHDGTSFSLVIDGAKAEPEDATKPVITSPLPTRLLAIGRDATAGDAGKATPYQGLVDEVRIWKGARPVPSISSASAVRLSGFEPGLAAYWKLDEGTGSACYDIVSMTPNLTLDGHKASWTLESAPMASGLGVTRRMLRLRAKAMASAGDEPVVDVVGPLTASLYAEQLQVVSKEGQDAKKPASGGSAEAKPLKRGTRLLLAFGASVPERNIQSQLAVLDVTVTSDGNLSDLPPLVALPQTGLVQGSFPTAILHVDASGHEAFGCIVTASTAKVQPAEGLSVLESALGSLSLYTRHGDRPWACVISYETTRQLKAIAAPSAGGATSATTVLGFGCSSKLRNVRNLEVTATPCAWLPAGLGVELSIKAECVDGLIRHETWRGAPRDPAKLSSLLARGTDGITARKAVARLADLSVVIPAKFDAEGKALSPDILELRLSGPLREALPSLTCIYIGPHARFQLVTDASAGDELLLTSRVYTALPEAAKPIVGRVIFASPYDGDLASSVSYPRTADVAAVAAAAPREKLDKGSRLLSVLAPVSAQDQELLATAGANEDPERGLVQLDKTVRVEGDVQGPSMGSGVEHAGLRLTGTNAYAVLNSTIAKPASMMRDFTFETWLRVEKAKDAVVVAHNVATAAAQEPLRSLTLCTSTAGVTTTGEFVLAGSVNGKAFKVQQPSVLLEKRWIHFAAVFQQAGALALDGSSYVDLGSGGDMNLADFTVRFSLCLDDGGRPAQLLYKAASPAEPTPLDLSYSPTEGLVLRFHDSNNTLRILYGKCSLASRTAYAITVSRAFKSIGRTHTETQNQGPMSAQVATFRVVDDRGETVLAEAVMAEDNVKRIGAEKDSAAKLVSDFTRRAVESASVCNNDASLFLGGAPPSSSSVSNLQGRIGDVELFSSPVKTPGRLPDAKARVSSWKALDDQMANVLFDDLNRNHGKFVGGPKRVPSPYAPDSSFTFYLNGGKPLRDRQQPFSSLSPVAQAAVKEAMPQQFTLGNYLAGGERFRFLGCREGFAGDVAEVRLWSVARMRESIADALHARLTDDSADLETYWPCDRAPRNHAQVAPTAEEQKCIEAAEDAVAVLQDHSLNAWHLTPIHAEAQFSASLPPVGTDAPLVLNAAAVERSGSGLEAAAARLSQVALEVDSRPSTAEYADMQQSLRGDLSGVFKRAYSTILRNGTWQLTTGFKIGSLTTSWVCQVQTNATLKGYIEGAPPVPAENYIKEGSDARPSSAIRFSEAKRMTSTFSARGESGTDFNLSASRTVGAKWDVSVGLGVQAKLTEGHVKLTAKTSLDVSNSEINNRVATSIDSSSQELRVELTGGWRRKDAQTGEDHYEANNVGVAWVESETADLYALRLKVRNRPPPLVAYQLRPNPDIPKDTNLMTFRINPAYCKQGCLDGKRGFVADDDYPGALTYSSDVSYFKPREAYALKDRIRRDEKKWSEDFERRNVAVTELDARRFGKAAVPKETQRKRQICNSYVWTAEGGTFQENNSTIDTVQTEVGGQISIRDSVSVSLDVEANVSAFLTNTGIDALYGSHFTLTRTRETSSETAFELTTELPGPVDLRTRENGRWVKRAGAVDAYRWMSFWLEPSTENTDVFFRKVVDPVWLASSREPNAVALAALQADRAEMAKQKAWRVAHRVTYVSRVMPKIAARLAAPSASAVADEKRLVVDVAGSWHLIQQLEPIAYAAKDRTALVDGLRSFLKAHYPAIVQSTRTLRYLVDFLQDRCRVPGPA